MSSISKCGTHITADPLLEAAIGTRLEISSGLFTCNPSSDELNCVANWDFFEGAVVAVHFGGTGRQHVLGTGVIVAPGVVMTARHVIEPQEAILRLGALEILCSGIVENELVLWRCHSVTLIGTADIALLMVEAASSLPKLLRQVTLTTRMPRISEEVVIVGFKHLSSSPVEIGCELQISMMAAKGKVTNCYADGRDKVLLPSPCFEVHCAATGGMSGGPAFDKDGFLLGIITSSMECSDGNGPAFISLPWPAFPQVISPQWPAGLYSEPTSLLKIDPRLCAIHRRDAIEIRQDKDSETYRVISHHWDT